MSKTTVAHLLPNYNPFPPTYPAGTELRVFEAARRETRYRPLVVCGWFEGQPESEDMPPMRVRRIRTGRAYRRLFQKLTRLDPLPYGARMWRIVQEEQAALIHIHNEPKLLAGLYPRLLESELPVVLHVANEKDVPREPIARVTRWVACSRYIAQWLEHGNDIPRDRIDVIYTGVDTASRRPQWELRSHEREALRRRFGITPETIVLVFAGRLVKEKGVAELLDAYERVRADNRDKRLLLLIAGNVRESDDPANEKAVYGRAIIERMKQMENVRWVGSLAPDDVHDFLLAGDIFVLPSLWHDPFPTVMLEAAAAGLPIIAAARGGITEFLEGCPAFDFVSDPADAQALAHAITRYVRDSDARDRAGGWLRERVERDFDWQRVCTQFEDLYDALLDVPVAA